MGIRENVRDIKARIAEVSGEESVVLLAATKTVTSAMVREAIEGGVDACGENRVQELLGKYDEGAYEGAPLHFIGHLQRNKVKYLVGKVSLIESVDSIELMRVISTRAQGLGLVQDVLLEVNIGKEQTKSGVFPEQVSEILEQTAALEGVKLRGLMTIPPKIGKDDGNLRYFDRMRELFIDNRSKKYHNICMDFLSMGMSSDYDEAVRAGANIVRVGSAIFGQRRN